MAPSGATWQVSLDIPRAALDPFEEALAALGGALAIDGEESGEQLALALYLERRPDAPELSARLAAAALSAGIPCPSFEVARLPVRDWVTESQKALPALVIGPFYLYGAHVTAQPPAGKTALRIEAGAAFGTGRHGSTRGCLLALARLAETQRPAKALDMGCGCGVLALAMASLWDIPVLALDNDPEAVAVCRENAALNGLAARISAGLSEGYAAPEVARRAPFDLVAANILAEPLKLMAEDLQANLAPGGLAVLSGLLSAQANEVRQAHGALALLDRIEIDGWATLLLQRPA
jgi:ribosomal protein L11 methyltransferase